MGDIERSDPELPEVAKIRARPFLVLGRPFNREADRVADHILDPEREHEAAQAIHFLSKGPITPDVMDALWHGLNEALPMLGLPHLPVRVEHGDLLLGKGSRDEHRQIAFRRVPVSEDHLREGGQDRESAHVPRFLGVRFLWLVGQHDGRLPLALGSDHLDRELLEEPIPIETRDVGSLGDVLGPRRPGLNAREVLIPDRQHPVNSLRAGKRSVDRHRELAPQFVT